MLSKKQWAPILVCLVAIGCKARSNSSLVQSTTDGVDVDEEALQRMQIELAGLIEQAEMQDLSTSNQWYQSHILRTLPREQLAKLGDPGQARSQPFALDDQTVPKTPEELLQQNERIRKLQANIAAAKDRLSRMESAMKLSSCKISTTEDYGGCYCYQRWKFDPSYPLKDPTQNPCNGRLGDFCGNGFGFQLPTPSRHPALLNFPQFAGATAPAVARADLMYFLEKGFTYRGCRTLGLFTAEGQATRIKDQLREALGDPWLRSPQSAPVLVRTKKEGEESCFDYRRKPYESPAEKREYWTSGQCMPLYAFNRLVDAAAGTETTKVLRNDKKHLLPESEQRRFEWTTKNEPFARIYCAKDWVVTSSSLHPEIQYGAITEIGATYAMVDTSLMAQEGGYSDWENYVEQARKSVENRWKKDCENAASYNQGHPLAPIRDNVYNWRCSGGAHWSANYFAKDEGSQAPENVPSQEKGIYCTFVDEAYEAVRNCEVTKGRQLGANCCLESLERTMRFSKDAAQAYCKNFNRSITFKGADEIEFGILCSKNYFNFLMDPGSVSLRDVVKDCREKLGVAFNVNDDPAKWDKEKQLLERKKATLAVTELEKERAPLNREVMRGYALLPSRDCERYRRINGLEAFVPCHEMITSGIPREKDPLGCYNDMGLPDICNGDPSAECVSLLDLPPSGGTAAPGGAGGPAPASNPTIVPLTAGVNDDLVWQCTDPRTKQLTKTPCRCQSALKVRLFR